MRVRRRMGASVGALDKDQRGESQFGSGDSINSVVLGPLKRAPRDDKRMTGCSSDKRPVPYAVIPGYLELVLEVRTGPDEKLGS